MDSQNDKMANLAQIESYIEEAVKNGAVLISLPEDVNLVGKNVGSGGNAEESGGLTETFFRKKAREHQIYLHCGSFHQKISDEKRSNNCSLFINPDGEVLAEYHKLHTFDITLEDGSESMESAAVRPGEKIVTAKTPLGNFGFSICYDVRFPELFRLLTLDGAEVIFTPANFTDATGKAHWEILLRARAIENGCYIIAADQCGSKPRYLAHGNSMIIDPWGTILARAEDKPGIIYAEIDLNRVREVRNKIPSLKNRRSDIYSLEKKA